MAFLQLITNLLGCHLGYKTTLDTIKDTFIAQINPLYSSVQWTNQLRIS